MPKTASDWQVELNAIALVPEIPIIDKQTFKMSSSTRPIWVLSMMTQLIAHFPSSRGYANSKQQPAGSCVCPVQRLQPLLNDAEITKQYLLL